MCAAHEIIRWIDGKRITHNSDVGACRHIITRHRCTGSRTTADCYYATAFLDCLAKGEGNITANGNTHGIVGRYG